MKTFNWIFIGGMAIFLGLGLYLISIFPDAAKEESFGPAFFPLTVIICSFGLLICLSYENLHLKAGAVDFSWDKIKMSCQLLGLSLILILILEQVGFFLASFSFLFVGMRLLGTKLRLSLIVSLGVTISIYVVFKLILAVPIPLGWGY